MMTFISWFLMVLLLYVLQTSFMPLLSYNGIAPDFLLLVTVSFAFLKGRHLGSLMGFILGLLEDFATGGFFGINIFSKMLVGYGCGVFSNKVLRDSFLLPVAASILGTFFVYCVFEVIMLLLGYGIYPLAHMYNKLIPMLCYNVIFSWPVHKLVHRVNDYVTKKSK